MRRALTLIVLLAVAAPSATARARGTDVVVRIDMRGPAKAGWFDPKTESVGLRGERGVRGHGDGRRGAESRRPVERGLTRAPVEGDAGGHLTQELGTRFDHDLIAIEAERRLEDPALSAEDGATDLERGQPAASARLTIAFMTAASSLG